MKKELKAVICVVLAVWFFVMGFEIGSYHEKKEFMSTTVPSVITPAETTVPQGQYDAPTSTTAPTTDLTSVSASPDQTTSPDNTTKPKDDTASWSKGQVLSKAVTAINQLKSEPNFKARKVEKTVINVTDCSAEKAMATINSVIQKFAGEETANYNFVSGQAVGVDDNGKEIKDEGTVTPKDVIPPKKALFTLAEDGVKEAVAESNGNGYIYTIKLVEERTDITNPVPNHNSKAIGYLDLSAIKVPGASFTEANMHYPESVVTVTVDERGRATNIHYYLPMDGSGAAKMAFISGTASFEGSTDEVWEIVYD